MSPKKFDQLFDKTAKLVKLKVIPKQKFFKEMEWVYDNQVNHDSDSKKK